MYDATRRNLQGHVSFLQGRSEFIDLSVDSERPANLNSDVPACITKEYVPKVTPSYQAGHEPNTLVLTDNKIAAPRVIALRRPDQARIRPKQNGFRKVSTANNFIIKLYNKVRVGVQSSPGI